MTPQHTSDIESPKRAGQGATTALFILGVALLLWAVSFVMTAVTEERPIGGSIPTPGWEAALVAFLMLGSKVLPSSSTDPNPAFDPVALSVTANFFMLFVPYAFLRVKEGRGQLYTTLFLVCLILPVSLPYIPPSKDLYDIQSFDSGYLVWVLSLIAAASWFSWAVWKKLWGLVPSGLLAAGVLCGMFWWFPAQRAEPRPNGAEDRRRLEQGQKMIAAHRVKANETIAAHGLSGLAEPLDAIQVDVLVKHITSDVGVTPEDLRTASEHYTNLFVMQAIAGNPKCPVEALDFLFKHGQYSASAEEPWRLIPLYLNIIQNPNVTPDLLVQIVRSPFPQVRSAAAKNPKLPHAEKLAYLARGCSFENKSENSYDIDTIARDPETPAAVLKCISTRPGGEGVADNPSTPVAVLEAMSHSANPNLAREGKRALEWRRTNRK